MKRKKASTPPRTYSPIPFTRAHSKPHRLEEFNRARRRREERDAKRGNWGQNDV